MEDLITYNEEELSNEELIQLQNQLEGRIGVRRDEEDKNKQEDREGEICIPKKLTVKELMEFFSKMSHTLSFLSDTDPTKNG